MIIIYIYIYETYTRLLCNDPVHVYPICIITPTGVYTCIQVLFTSNKPRVKVKCNGCHGYNSV